MSGVRPTPKPRRLASYENVDIKKPTELDLMNMFGTPKINDKRLTVPPAVKIFDVNGNYRYLYGLPRENSNLELGGELTDLNGKKTLMRRSNSASSSYR